MALKRQLVIAAVAVASSGVLSGMRPSTVDASCATLPSLPRAIAHAPVVFVGRVVATRNHSMIATVRVLDVWRGTHVAKAVVVENDSQEDSRTFRVGVTYLFVPEPVEVRSPFYDNACTATRRYSPAVARYRPRGAHKP
jgi:hypothetical protein